MLTNLELYGTEDVPRVPADVCNERIAMLKNRLEVEASKFFMEQDNNLINTLLKAIKHWQRLRDGEEENE